MQHSQGVLAQCTGLTHLQLCWCSILGGHLPGVADAVGTALLSLTNLQHLEFSYSARFDRKFVMLHPSTPEGWEIELPSSLFQVLTQLTHVSHDQTGAVSMRKALRNISCLANLQELNLCSVRNGPLRAFAGIRVGCHVVG